MTTPSRDDLEAARDANVPDVLAPNLRVLFCGINPGLYSAAVGHHFARPGNRFWKALHAAGFTDRLLGPERERELLDAGIGITNLVARATAAANELQKRELRSGARTLERKVRSHRPAALAVLGIDAFRVSFGERAVIIGRQPHALAGAAVWVLPNPSGLNAHYQLADLAVAFAELREGLGHG